MESTEIRSLSVTELLLHKKSEQELIQFLRKQVINNLKSQGISSVGVGNDLYEKNNGIVVVLS